MDGLGLVLYWSALSFAVVAILVPGVSRAYAWIAAALLVAGPATLAVAPDLAPWFAVPVGVLLCAPGLLGLAVNAEIGAERYRVAHGLALARVVLHPVAETRAMARYCGAIALLQRGREEEALMRLRRIASCPSRIGLLARFQLSVDREDAAALLADPRLDEFGGMFRLRALGAAGQIDAMLDVYRALVASRPAAPLATEIGRAAIVLMYAGRPRGVVALNEGPRAGTARNARAYQAAYAGIVAGGDERRAGLAVLRDQAGSADGLVRHRAALGLADLPASLAPLDREHAALLDRLEAAIAALPARRPWWRAPVSLALVAVNFAVFLVEAVGGGTTDTDTLYRLGALPTIGFDWVTDGWRLVTEMFLHSGPIHIGANMATLLVLGPPIERMTGPWRFLLLYLGSGLAANAGCILLADAGLLGPEIIVGASGALMGLIGGVAGAALRAWILTRAPVFMRRLVVILVFVALQVAIDTTLPHVSSSTHLLGVGAGVLIGFVLPFRWPIEPGAFAESIEPASDPPPDRRPSCGPALGDRRFRIVLVVGSISASFWLAST